MEGCILQNFVKINLTSKKNKSKSYNLFRWTLITFIILIFVLSPIIEQVKIVARPVFSIFLVFFAFLHGTERYGFKNISLFFIIVWIVSNFFESTSIFMGFPFGNYYYTTSGPRIFEVPIYIMILYFGMGYLAWTLANILLGEYGKRLKGIQVFLVPFTLITIDIFFNIQT